MPIRLKRIRLLHIVLGMLLVIGPIPLAVAGWLLSDRSATELRSVEARYQVQLVRDKARQIELFGQRYRDVVTGLARAFELAGGVRVMGATGSDARLRRALQDDPNLLALAILPVQGEPHLAYKPDAITREEVDESIAAVLARVSGKGVVTGRPRLIRSSQEMGWTIAAPVMSGTNDEEISAAVVAVVSFQDVFRIVWQSATRSADDLLTAGVPVIFVVDDNGRAVAHPDPGVALASKSMVDFKVVQDWMEMGAQVESALSPFVMERDGKRVAMLGAYATAELGPDTRLGIISVQDERAALRSVSDMRAQIWGISLVGATIALIAGVLFARQLTRPVQELAAGARRIASGDFSYRLRISSRTELGELGASFNRMTDQLERFIEDLRRAADENRELFIGTVKALATAIDNKDPYTRGHSERVSRFSVAIARRLGLTEDEVEKVRISALLHDVGKIGIDDRILKKPAPLTDEEFEIMKQHPQKGYRIMSQIPAMREFLPGIYMHHERLDGLGYPQGLKEDEIPLQARIISVADSFDAMTTDRPYQRGMNAEAALELIQSHVGTRYDGRVVQALIEAYRSGQVRPVGVRPSRSTEQLAPASVPLERISA
jgi:HD-GYP domain-containing protein (c-di-GMP phosphodiesterase class II)